MMKTKLSNNELKMLKEIEQETMTDYGIEDNWIEVDALVVALEDLLRELKNTQEEFEDYKAYKQGDFDCYMADEYHDMMMDGVL